MWFNYGMFPQTWEGPELKSAEGYGGDKDPLDGPEQRGRRPPRCRNS